MITILTILLVNFICFQLGRASGKLESVAVFPQKVLLLVNAVKKVESLCALKGQKISDLSNEELCKRVSEQLALTQDEVY